jgi:hypothetical protein
MNHETSFDVASAAIPGVCYRLKRISFGRRLELARVLRDKLDRLDRAMLLPEGPARETETAVVASEIGAAELRWGLQSIEGLEIDSAPASAETLIDNGPEPLVLEILAAIRHEAGLDEEERKNSEPPSTSCAGPEPDGAMRGSAATASASGSTAAAIAAATSLNPSIPDCPGSCGAPDPTSG